MYESQYRGVIYKVYNRSTSIKVSIEESFMTYYRSVCIKVNVEESHL